jgi:hypothetical protein
MAVFLVVVQCSPVEAYRRFRYACYLHHQGDGSLIMNDELGRMCKELVVVSQDNIPAFT